MSMKNSNDSIGNRTHDFPACSAVSQPIAPPRTHKSGKEGINKFPSDYLVGIPFAVCKEVIRSHLRQEHLNILKACHGCRQSKPLKKDSLPSRTRERQEMSRPKLKQAVGLLTGHTTLRVRMFKFRLTQRQNFRL